MKMCKTLSTKQNNANIFYWNEYDWISTSVSEISNNPTDNSLNMRDLLKDKSIVILLTSGSIGTNMMTLTGLMMGVNVNSNPPVLM